MRRDILILKLGALGDMVMATGLIRQIQRHHTGSRHTLVTTPAYAGLFSSWPDLELKTFDRNSLLSTLAVSFWIRQNRFLRVYDLQSNDRTAVICSLSGIPEKAGNHPRLPYNIHPATRYTGQCHIHTRMQEILSAAGIPPGTADPCLPPTQTDREKVADWLKMRDLHGKKLVIVHAGASAWRPEKRWPYFPELAVYLGDRGCRTVWIGAEDDRDLNASLARVTGVDASAEFSFTQLVALTEHARFALANDSGPMHVLACGDIPVYGLFGPTNWRRNHAVGQQDRVLSLDRDEPAFQPTRLKDLKADCVIRQLERDGVV